MHRLSRLRRWAVHVAVLALVLKAAVPLLASAAASMRGVAVGEVCDVYGVVLPRPASAHAAHAAHRHHDHVAVPTSGDASAHEHDGHESGASHRSEHCALVALAVLGLPDIGATPSFALPPVLDAELPRTHASIRDDAALWAARLTRGPPA